jgi:hypothetical protein
MSKEEKKLTIYQANSGAIELRSDSESETIWANQKQISQIFDVDRSVITRHIKNIFQDQEVDEKVVSAKFAHTTKHGFIKGKTQTKEITFYNLDIILAVGYRTNSQKAIEFRKWATKTLKQHITQGYTINQQHFEKNKKKLLEALDDIKLLAKDNQQITSDDILELVKTFTDTWFTLDQYDKSNFPSSGVVKKDLEMEADKLYSDIAKFKKELIRKKEATELFAQEKKAKSLEGILGNVFQSAFGEEVYPTVEQKAAHLLYFVVKNHAFNDGNKRTGAFSFVWLLRKAGMLNERLMTPMALTSLTLLIAESDPGDKDKMIGLVLLFLKKF